MSYKKEQILNISNYKFNSYENASEHALSILYNKLNDLNESKEELPHLSDYLNEENPHVSSIDLYLKSVISHLPYTVERIKDHKNISQEIYSITEMAIIYLLKNIEIAIKRIIEIAYNDIDIKSLYRWESLEGLLVVKNIQIKEITGYKEFKELWDVNNNLKHSGKVSDKVKKIKEFKNLIVFEFTALLDFYERNKQHSELFLKGLGEAVIKDLYEFNDERLKLMSEVFKERMDKETLKKFINKLKE